MRMTILAHGDSDGVCSAALLKAAYSGIYDQIDVYFTHPAGLLGDFKEYAKGDVYIVDVAIDEWAAPEILRAFEKYRGRIVYIDHHPPPSSFSPPPNVEIFHKLGAAASELAFRYVEGLLPETYDRVALYGAIGDYLDNTDWVEEALGRWDKRVIYFEAGVLSQGLEGARRLHDLKRDIVRHLSENKPPSSHEELLARAIEQSRQNERLAQWVPNNIVREGLVAYVIDPPGPLGLAATLARGTAKVPVGIALETRKDIYVLSLRSSGFDLNEFLRDFSRRYRVPAGGHPSAAGARLPKDLFKTLLNELNYSLRRKGFPS